MATRFKVDTVDTLKCSKVYASSLIIQKKHEETLYLFVCVYFRVWMQSGWSGAWSMSYCPPYLGWSFPRCRTYKSTNLRYVQVILHPESHSYGSYGWMFVPFHWWEHVLDFFRIHFPVFWRFESICLRFPGDFRRKSPVVMDLPCDSPRFSLVFAVNILQSDFFFGHILKQVLKSNMFPGKSRGKKTYIFHRFQ